MLAISSKERMTAVPDIPTMDESGVPGVDIMGWWGVAVPAGVPQPIKDKISSAFLKMAEKPETKEWLSNLGGDAWVVGPARGAGADAQGREELGGLRADRQYGAEGLSGVLLGSPRALLGRRRGQFAHQEVAQHIDAFRPRAAGRRYPVDRARRERPLR